MAENKSMLVAAAIITGALIVAGALFYAANTMSYKMASVDMEQVIQKSELGKKINKELESKGKELNERAKLAKTDQEKSQLSYEFNKFKSDKQQEFYKNVQEVTAKVAKQKGIKAVPRPEMFIYTGTDLTQDVIKALDK